ncbi:DUF4430 domain-containing protein [Methanosarcina acetivorans]|uniref:Transcobalamin-like C-terminal domain-containing protein n=1 Tax=Methanosarcina acetivorans (strain ATCC 35395 / DSM 2834 / JCM 12185 / C2A) TaxID=188937 RepID=Q8TI52_METAC|nr:DUF4430 domain-containing protein [Methanosarcina acetivorans]AAM07648.1 predicted protein [Methanosarcina acetivorans C2A]
MKNKITGVVIIAFLSAIMIGTVAAQPAEIFNGTVTLEDGTFTFIPSNNLSGSYQVEVQTDHGALEAASNDETSGFTYNASDEYYEDYGSFYLTDINGVEDDPVASTSWFIYINDELAPLGLSQNVIEDEDQVTFLYSPYEITENWEIVVDTANASYIVDIGVEVEDALTSIEDLQEHIDSLAAPPLTKCILIASLDSVIYSLENGRDQIAIFKLQCFKNIVQRQEYRGNLSHEEAEYIIDEADHIIELIQ